MSRPLPDFGIPGGTFSLHAQEPSSIRAWNLFDQIIVSRSLLNPDSQPATSSLKLCDYHIFRRDYLFQHEGKYKGNTLRTHAGGQWLDGYSDHLPTVVYLKQSLK